MERMGSRNKQMPSNTLAIVFFTGYLCSPSITICITQSGFLAIVTRSGSTVQSHALVILYKRISKNFLFLLGWGKRVVNCEVFITQNSLLTLLTLGKWITCCLIAVKSLYLKKCCDYSLHSSLEINNIYLRENVSWFKRNKFYHVKYLHI